MSDMVGSLKVIENVNWISKEMNPQSQSFQHGAVAHYNIISPPCFTMLFELQSWVDTVFMDSMAPVAEAPVAVVSQELARESLMAISQSIPEKNLSSPLPTNYTDANVVDVKESVEAEEYRSKLISISYTESLDVQPTPSALENLRS